AQQGLDKARAGSWAIVSQSCPNAFQYRFALLEAEHAWLPIGRRIAPASGRLSPAPAVTGRRSRPWGQPTGSQGAPPGPRPSLTMPHHRPGHHEQARATLAQLHKLLDQPRRMKDAEALDLMREAQALIPPPRATIER